MEILSLMAKEVALKKRRQCSSKGGSDRISRGRGRGQDRGVTRSMRAKKELALIPC